MLIIPAATARWFSSSPEQMAVLAAGIGSLAVAGGLMGSLEWDTPAGPSIVVGALILFVVSVIAASLVKRRSRSKENLIEYSKGRQQ